MAIAKPQPIPRSQAHVAAPSAGAGWAAVLLAATLWGTTGIVFHALGHSGGANAASIGFARLALSVPFLLAMARARTGVWLAALTLRGLATLSALGLAMAAYQLTYVLALERVGVAIAVLISICGAPIFVALISVACLGERLRARTMVALATAIAGTVLMVGLPSAVGGAGHRFGIGIALAVACALCQALYVLAAQASSKVCGPMHAGGIAFGIGALALLPIAWSEGLHISPSPGSWAMLLYVAAVPTAIAQTLFLIGLQGTGAVGGAIASLLEPLVATLLAVMLLHERMHWTGAIGAALLLSGIGILQWSPGKRGASARMADDPGRPGHQHGADSLRSNRNGVVRQPPLTSTETETM